MSGMVWEKRLTYIVMLWAMAITTFVTVIMFTAPPDIPGGTASAYAAFLTGPLVAGFALYKWAREKPHVSRTD
jgi:hypothetical protein